MNQFGGSKSIKLVVLRTPSIKTNLIKLGIKVFLNDVANSPISLAIFSIDKIINVIDLPNFFGWLIRFYTLLLLWHSLKWYYNQQNIWYCLLYYQYERIYFIAKLSQSMLFSSVNFFSQIIIFCLLYSTNQNWSGQFLRFIFIL